jgi:hypothetical protein
VQPIGIQSQRAPGPGLALGYWPKGWTAWALAARPRVGWAGSNEPSAQGERKRPGWARGPKNASASPCIGPTGEAGGGGAAAGRAGVAGHACSARAKTGASPGLRSIRGSRRPSQVTNPDRSGVARNGDLSASGTGAVPGRCTGAAAAAKPSRARRGPCTEVGPSPSRRKRGGKSRRKREPLPPGAKADRRPWRREPPSSTPWR